MKNAVISSMTPSGMKGAPISADQPKDKPEQSLSALPGL
jgi:hypothetical protein